MKLQTLQQLSEEPIQNKNPPKKSESLLTSSARRGEEMRVRVRVTLKKL